MACTSRHGKVSVIAGHGFVGWVFVFMRCIVYSCIVLVNSNIAHIHISISGLPITANQYPLNLNRYVAGGYLEKIMSILSFENRGEWGKSSWRGNCSGYVYKSLFEQYRPKIFIDPMVGSGTSVEVAVEMGIEAHGLDLHSGFNILHDSILQRVGKEGDLVFSHPPYHDMIVYSGQVWGQPHQDDLSRCVDDEDFLEKIQVALLNQREATKPGGLYGLLIGDLRRNGRYSSYQASCIERMPKSELAAVVIKAQHNCVSDSRQYAKMKHMRVLHEYIILWNKPKGITVSILSDLSDMAKQQATALRATWRAIVRHTLITLGGTATLSDIYSEIAKAAPERLSNNDNWKAKIRQTLQLIATPVERGVWSI